MGRFSQETARLIFFKIVQGVTYLHSQRVCHRDLKLDNILLASSDPQSKIFIGDFGLSKMWRTMDQLRSRVGE